MGAICCPIGGRFSVAGSRQAFHREPGWESLLSKAAERLHAKVAEKAGLERDLDSPRKGVGA